MLQTEREYCLSTTAFPQLYEVLSTVLSYSLFSTLALLLLLSCGACFVLVTGCGHLLPRATKGFAPLVVLLIGECTFYGGTILSAGCRL